MGAAQELIEEIELSHLVPLNSLKPESLNELISRSTIKRLPPGRHIFDQGDTDNMTVYLLSGQLALVADGEAAVMIKAGSNDALNPIANQQPRASTALARTCVTTLNIDTHLLNKFFSGGDDPDGDPVEKVTTSKHEQIKHALEVPLFSRLPQPHKQVLMNRFEEIRLNEGNVIIRQGSESKYYYLITEGRCGITEKVEQFGMTPEYTELTAGCGFGEEALITNSPYKYTVTMLEDGRLLALSRGEFMTLLVRPLIKQLSYQQVTSMDPNRIGLIDLRTPGAFHKSHLPGSINLPLSVLKDAAPILDRDREYIVCSDSHQRNIVAAFLLLKQGLDAKILDQGIRKTLISLS